MTDNKIIEMTKGQRYVLQTIFNVYLTKTNYFKECIYSVDKLTKMMIDQGLVDLKTHKLKKEYLDYTIPFPICESRKHPPIFCIDYSFIGSSNIKRKSLEMYKAMIEDAKVNTRISESRKNYQINLNRDKRNYIFNEYGFNNFSPKHIQFVKDFAPKNIVEGMLEDIETLEKLKIKINNIK